MFDVDELLCFCFLAKVVFKKTHAFYNKIYALGLANDIVSLAKKNTGQ